MRQRAYCVALLLLLLTVSAFGAEYKIVVHHLNPTTSLSKAVVADYFLKKKRTWPDDRPVVVVDQAVSSRVRETFSIAVLGRPVAAVSNYWHNQIFSGRDVPPLQEPSDQKVIEFVRSSPGAIGYVSATADTGDLKIVTVH